MNKTSGLAKYQAKLAGGKFRWLNETLYTTTGAEALEFFQQDSQLFAMYHEGFAEQVCKWPVNPLDRIIGYIKAKCKKSLVIGDFGCGEARLQASVENKVFSFDLVAANKNVIPCSVDEVPLDDDSLDIAVFCLSLMGTDFLNFIKEASRVLKVNGELIVAEVKSRFVASGNVSSSSSSSSSNHQKSSGKNNKSPSNASTGAKKEEALQESMIGGIEEFCTVLEKLGFQLKTKNIENKMFVLFHFIKIKSLDRSKRKRERAGEEEQEEDDDSSEHDEEAKAKDQDKKKKKNRNRKNKKKKQWFEDNDDGSNLKLKACEYKRR